MGNDWAEDDDRPLTKEELGSRRDATIMGYGCLAWIIWFIANMISIVFKDKPLFGY